MIVHTAEIGGRRLSYVLCRILPDTALVLRDVLREAARQWAAHLGDDHDAAMRASEAGEAFFTGRVRLEPVPPEREMVAVWLPFPPDFASRIKPQLIDFVEPFDPAKMALEPPHGWPRDS